MEKTLKTMPLFRLLETTAAQRRRRYLSLAISVVVEIIIIVSLVSILRLVPLPMVGPKER